MNKPKGRKRFPGIYLRGANYWYTLRVRGKKQFHNLHTTEEAAAIVRAMEIARNPEERRAAVFDEEIAAFVAHKLAKNEYSRFSASAKRHTLVEFREFMVAAGRLNPGQVSDAEALRYYRGLQARVAETTAQGYLSTVRSFYKWLLKARKVRRNPLDALELVKIVPRGRDKFCSPALRDKLIAEAPTDELRLILYLGFHCGLRKNEIIEARPEWFDLDRGLLTVRATDTFVPKDREERTIPLTGAFRAFLADYAPPSPFVVRPEAKKGGGLYRWDFRFVFGAYVKTHGAEWVTPHVMRHTMASLLASAGVNIFKIAKWMGDGVKIVETHYAKLSPDRDEDIEKAFA